MSASERILDPSKLTPRQLMRFSAFDNLLYWERELNVRILAERLVEPQDTIKVGFEKFRKYYRLDQIAYDSIEKRFKPTSTFAPKFALGTIQEYATLIESLERKGVALQASPLQALQWIDHGPGYHHQPDPVTFGTIVRAIRQCKAVAITYSSWHHPNGTERTIHPHAVAQSHNRWHCRAFDEFRKEYRDFNLGRIARLHIDPRRTYIDGAADVPWTTIVTLRLAPNPDLSEPCRAMIEREYNMDRDHELKLQCRLPMVQYVIQSLPVVDPKEPRPDNPMKQYLVVKNPGEIRDGLF